MNQLLYGARRCPYIPVLHGSLQHLCNAPEEIMLPKRVVDVELDTGDVQLVETPGILKPYSIAVL